MAENFDPEQFLDSVLTDQAGETEYTAVASGEYNAGVNRLGMVQPKEAGQSPILEVYWRIDSPDNPGANGRQVRQSLFLDMDGSKLAKGENRNIRLNQLRDAVGQNKAGPWNPRMLMGTMARISVSQDPAKDGSGRIYNRVDGVTAI